VEARRFENGADVSDRLSEGSIRAAVDGGRARGRSHKSEQHAQRRRLAGAVRSEEPDDAAAPEPDGEIVDRHDVAEVLRESVECDDSHGSPCPFLAFGRLVVGDSTVRRRPWGVIERARGS
jgi:hypothetical protein